MVRAMTITDYPSVYALWKTIPGFGIRAIDDSEEGIERFLLRNPSSCAVAEQDGHIVGAILCGHDGRSACFYHVCVAKEYRRRGIGSAMVRFCIEALKREEINRILLNAFIKNEIGNLFWQSMGWRLCSDSHYYDYILNERNVTVFNDAAD
ncbi:MAG: GNAT family N-acetyltransferase [Lachnospiraceae bacterium]|nr:GNAT family N-acetyltransferase [Lachnospiraceae bacterium]